MAKIGRPKAALVITDVERAELVRLTKRAHVNRLLAFRARLVLACADAPHGHDGGASVSHHQDHRGEMANAIHRAPTRGLAG